MPPLPNNQAMDNRPPSPATQVQYQPNPQSAVSLHSAQQTPNVAVSGDSTSDIENSSAGVGIHQPVSANKPITSTPNNPPPFNRNAPKRHTVGHPPHGQNVAKATTGATTVGYRNFAVYAWEFTVYCNAKGLSSVQLII